jgi:hypothetical protein
MLLLNRKVKKHLKIGEIRKASRVGNNKKIQDGTFKNRKR